MAGKFNFRILANKAAYEAMNPKDAMTFYLTKTGEGWLGEESLFGGDAEKFHLITKAGEVALEADKSYVFAADGITVSGQVYPQGLYYSTDGTAVNNITYKTIAQYIVDKAVKASDISAAYEGDETSVMTSAAIVQYVADMIAAQNLMDIAFFKNVIPYELTQADIDDAVNGTTIGPAQTQYPAIMGIAAEYHVGDQGLIFVTDNLGEGEEDEKSYIFVNLHKLINIYNVKSDDNSVTVTTTVDEEGHKTTFDISVNKATDDIADSIRGGADVMAEGGAYDTSALADNKFVTEKYLAEVMAKVLKDYVTYVAE